jgi:SAM-dependent methyltransferase
VDYYDYRPASLNLSNLTSRHADLTALPFAEKSIQSLSCMHVVEHIGLGRYGDPLDYDGDLKAIAELKRVVAPGGTLLFVVPTAGQPRIAFNSHRVYSYRQIRDLFADFELKQFALIPDSAQDGDLVLDADEAMANRQWYGCGCYWFQKQPSL